MILVAGSANLDFVVRANHIPAPGETVLGRDFETFPGGKGANQAVACRRAGGAATQFLTALGADAFAAPIEASLKDAQLDLHIVRSTTLATGTAFICVSDDAENAITVAPGANLALAPKHLPALTGVTHLLMQLETPMATVLAYAQSAKNQGVSFVLNAAPAQTLSQALLSLVDVLIVNEGELATITNCSGDVSQCLARLEVPTVVVTLGARGSCARVHGELIVQPAFTVSAIDTTAAGDTFCGVLIASLSHGLGMPQALRCASAAAALACTRLGAQASVPHATEVASFLATHTTSL